MNAKFVELCQQHVVNVPDSPSQRLGRTVSAELESALLACLEKSRAKRPQTARDLSELLDRAPTAGSWSLDDAEAWWGRHERSQVTAAGASGSAASSSPGNTTSASPNSPPARASSSPSAPAARTSTGGFDQTMAVDDRKA